MIKSIGWAVLNGVKAVYAIERHFSTLEALTNVPQADEASEAFPIAMRRERQPWLH